MEDSKIISLFVSRQESGIVELVVKYGSHLRRMAYGILNSSEDAKECENDTYLRTWNTIPPVIPESLKAYVTRIVRNLSLDRYRARNTGKRSFEVDCLH